MINIKKIFSVILLTFLLNNEADAVIKDSLFATVGNKAITHSDIIEEIKLILILTNRGFAEDEREMLEQTAIKSVVRRKIKLIEIQKYNFSDFNKEDLDRELNMRAVNLGLNIDELKMIFETNEINIDKVVDNIKVELLWNGLIFSLYKDRLSISKSEIEEQLKLIQDKNEIQEYLISEIIIKPTSTEKIEFEIEKIKKKIEIEGFENVARNLSISETASQGGDLGWVNENTITEEFKSEITNTPLGNISKPIILTQGVLIFKVRDTRKLKKFKNLDDKKNYLVNAEKNKILKMYSLTHYDKLKRSTPIKYHYYDE